MGDIETARVERIVERAVELHQARCPAVRAVGDALKDMVDAVHAVKSEMLQAFAETNARMVRGEGVFALHQQRIESVERSLDDIKKNQTSLTGSIIRLLIAMLAGGGFGAAVVNLIP
jgi:hypothetical protein